MRHPLSSEEHESQVTAVEEATRCQSSSVYHARPPEGKRNVKGWVERMREGKTEDRMGQTNTNTACLSLRQRGEIVNE